MFSTFLRNAAMPSKKQPAGTGSGLIRCICVLLLLSFPGCGQSDSSEGADDHHMAHFVPEHKPANFAEAVHELQHRTEHLRLHIGDERERVSHELEELTDIVGWVPELAADSDLNEADWILADSISREMLAACEASAGSFELEALLTAMQPQIESLEPLVARAGRPEPAIHHDHDHDHDHHDDDDHDEHDEHDEHDDHDEHSETDQKEQG